MSISQPTKVLIITSSGGGGHLQLALAKEQELREEYSEVNICIKDVMNDWVWRPIGWFFVELWNMAQRGGIVWIQSACCAIPRVADAIMWPYIFIGSLYTLFKENADRVIDTQMFGTSATIKAIRIFNAIRKKNLCLEKFILDLPTKKSFHFLGPIKRLSTIDRTYLKLIAIEPLVDIGQTPEEFWQINCKLPLSKLTYQYFYVRKSFKNFYKKEKNKEASALQINYKCKKELDLMLKSIQRGSANYSIFENKIEFTLEPTALVFTIILGSQPASDATLNYIKAFVEVAKEGKKIPTYLFVYCAGYTPLKPNLFTRTIEYITQIEDYPSSLTIIPMTFQTDDIIAPLFFRSNMTCTRSGGQTSMELMCVDQANIWIHSETKNKGKVLENSDLMRGIPGWEAGNAAYLQRFRNAQLVTPETIGLLVRKLLVH